MSGDLLSYDAGACHEWVIGQSEACAIPEQARRSLRSGAIGARLGGASLSTSGDALAKRATSFDLTLPSSEGICSKQKALYIAIRDSIVSRSIGPNQRLPSTRDLARARSISRGTAVIVYEQLEAEGYVVTRRGAGTFASASLPEDRQLRPSAATDANLRQRAPPHNMLAPQEKLSRLGRKLVCLSLTSDVPEGDSAAFLPFRPALDEFPIGLWARFAAKHARLIKPHLLADGFAAGWPRLQMAIAAYLRTTRGIDCSHEQIIITPSTRHSLLLCGQLLADPGDAVLFEDPGEPEVHAALQVVGLEVVPVPVDSQGIRVDIGERLSERARLLYATPNHQCPTGVVISAERRQALLDWAARRDAWLFENDREGEFLYAGRPIPSLYAMGGGARVLHAGSFSKTLFPALRLAYLVVPSPLAEAFARAQALYGIRRAILPQMVLCDFIESGHLIRHVRRMAELYRERRAVLVEALNEHFGDMVAITPNPCGLELTVWWGNDKSAQAIAKAAASQGLYVQELSRFRLAHPIAPGGVLGFAAYKSTTLRNAVGRLAAALDANGRSMRSTLCDRLAWTRQPPFRASDAPPQIPIQSIT